MTAAIAGGAGRRHQPPGPATRVAAGVPGRRVDLAGVEEQDVRGLQAG